MNLPCPTCHKPLEWSPENAYRPFCSHRCQLLDLGDWASEAHRIPAEPAFFVDEESGCYEGADANSVH